MSKAFTRESDDAPEEPLVLPPRPVLPPGARNYITADGARRLQEELEQLTQVKRPAALAAGDSPDARRRLQMVDQRIQRLNAAWQTMVVVEKETSHPEQVRFGATVTTRARDGEEETYRIVGIDEVDLGRNWISWLSPLAKALLNSRAGQRVHIRLPAGDQELEIVRVAYE